MKSLKLIAAGLLAAASINVASAVTYIKITGSTAFRKANINAIVNSLTSPKGAFAAAAGSTATDISGQARVVIKGTVASGDAAGQVVVYQLALAGSVGGVHAIDDGTLTSIPGASFDGAHTWLKDDVGGNTLTTLTVSSGAVTGATWIDQTNASAFESFAQANASFSDSLSGSTPFTSNTNVAEVDAGPVGVIDFYWVKGASYAGNAAKYASLTNITQQQAAALQKSGNLPLSVFTGNPADNDVDVICVGRNSDSGTRLAAEAEAQLGFQLIAPTLYRAISAAGGITNDWTGFSEVGYDSGAKVAADLRVVFNAGIQDENLKPFILVGYVGKSDKNTAIAGGVAAVLSYNGVTPSDTKIQEGLYTFWTYQHTYHRYTSPTDIGKEALESQAGRVISTDFVQSGLKFGDMHVSRLFEGASVNP